MKKKLKTIVILFFLTLGLLYMSVPVFAQPSEEIKTCDETCLDPLRGPSNETFDALNPIPEEMRSKLSSPGSVLTRVLNFSFPIAGIILFVMLVWSGFDILSRADDKQALTTGKNRATAATIGFIALFCSYWMMQIVEYIFGIHIL